jgi:hypothetical protein
MTAGGLLTPKEKEDALRAMVNSLMSVTGSLCHMWIDQDTDCTEIPESTVDMIEHVHNCYASNEHNKMLHDAEGRYINSKLKLQECIKAIWRLHSKELGDLKKHLSSEDMVVLYDYP